MHPRLATILFSTVICFHGFSPKRVALSLLPLCLFGPGINKISPISAGGVNILDRPSFALTFPLTIATV
jgi:hypothetical protein